MKFPITKAEFLAWCRENGGRRVEPSCSRCLIAVALQSLDGDPWMVSPGTGWADEGIASCERGDVNLPNWADDLATKFDRQFAFERTTVRTALRELAGAGVPGFTKQELREAAGLE